MEEPKEVQNDEVQEPIEDTPPAESVPVEDTPPAESVPVGDMVPVAVVAELRESRREAREESARLRQELLDLQQRTIPQPETEKSPIEQFVDEFGPDAAIDGQTWRAQQKWDTRQAALENQKQQQAEQVANSKAAAADVRINFSAAKMGEGLDFNSLEAMGQHLLTEGDLLDISRAGSKAASVAYERLQDRILRSSLAPTLKALHEKRQKSSAKPKPKVEDKQSSEEDAGEPVDVEMSSNTRRLSDFIFT